MATLRLLSPGKLIAYIAILLVAYQAAAEPVSINRGEGQGFVFAYNGNCFVVLPQHVHGRARTIEIGTSAPTSIAVAEILNLRSPYDLSLGYVRPGLESRCRDSWDQMPDDITALLESRGNSLSIIWVSASGATSKENISIQRTDLYTFEVKSQSKGGIFKGRSGSMVVSNGTLVGMVIEAKDNDTTIVLRMDEIKNELRRILGDRRASAPVEASPRQQTPKNHCIAGTIPIKSITCSKFALSAESSCNALLTGGFAAFAAEALPVSMELEFASNEPVAVSKVSFYSNVVEEGYSSPKNVSVFLDSTQSGVSKIWRRFGGQDMSPDGNLQLANGSSPYARRLKIELKSSWDDELPVRLDCILINP